jgi:hypothetical protein
VSSASVGVKAFATFEYAVTVTSPALGAAFAGITERNVAIKAKTTSFNENSFRFPIYLLFLKFFGRGRIPLLGGPGPFS